MKLFAIFAVTITCFFQIPTEPVVGQDKKQKKPNILWLFQEDLSPWIGCYGYEIQKGHTPTIDGMAKRGVRFSRAYVPAPVCSICRSAIITGANQIRFGAHEHRSRRGEAELPLPDGMKTICELMREQAGYYCFNIGKTDYNFEHSKVYDLHYVGKKPPQSPWNQRKEGQPFFGQIQLKGGKLNTTKFKNKCDRSAVTIPPDYPQNDLYRETVAEHFDSARMDDGIIQGILDQLEADGLTDSTIVVYFSDHGANNLVRHKQQPTDGGAHVPFVITGPDPWVPAASVRDDLVDMLDLSATTLAWAGVEQPAWMEGQDLFGQKIVPREFVGTARDRCDHTVDRIRSIRTDRFRFTRNYFLDRVLLQPQYRDRKPFLSSIRESYAEGTLDEKLVEIYFGERPYEELYDVKTDPHQLNNLIDDPKFAAEVARHQKLMDGWLAKGDTGAGTEPDIELKMASHKKWGVGVNAEYERIREDSDGDGLSDEWEKINGRDPSDGVMEFTFDCGGWQTEGWKADGELTNIAGRQGFLNFDLLAGNGAIVRKGLSLDADKNQGTILFGIRSSRDVKVELFANDLSLGTAIVSSGEKLNPVGFPQTKLSGTKIESLRLDMRAKPGTTVEIDEIKLVR